MTKKLRPDLKTLTQTLYPDNTSGEITPADIRAQMDNIVDSVPVVTEAIRPPVETDDAFNIGDIWIDSNSGYSYTCMSGVAGDAVWAKNVVQSELDDLEAIFQDDIDDVNNNLATAIGNIDVTVNNALDAEITGILNANLGLNRSLETVAAATTANITLSAAQTIDGVAVTAGQRVLVRAQTTSSQNGVYVVAAGAWTRATDNDAAGEFYGRTVFVTAGTANVGKTFGCMSVVTTVGTDAVSWVQIADQAGEAAARIAGDLEAKQKTAVANTVAATGATFSTRLGFGRFFDGADVDLTDGSYLVSHLIPSFRVATGGVTVRYRLWEREETSTIGVGPGDGVTDVLILDLSLPLSGFPGLTAGGAAADVDISFGKAIFKRPGFAIGFEAWCENASSAFVVVGIGTNNTASLIPVRRALFLRPTPTTWSSSPTLQVAGTLYSSDALVPNDPVFISNRERLAAVEVSAATAATDASTAKTITDFLTTTQLVGRKATPIAGLDAGDRVYVGSEPVSGSGYLNKLTLQCGAAGTIAVKRMSRDGATFTQVGPDLVLPVSIGLNTFTRSELSDIKFQAGELPGIYFPTNGLIFTNNTADGSGYYTSAAASGNVSEFVDTIVSTTTRLEIQFEFVVIASASDTGATTTVSGVTQKTQGAVGVHGYAARMALAFNNSTPKTFYMAMAVPARFSGIRLILGHATTNVDMTVSGASIGLLGAIADTTGATPHNSPVTVTFDGQASVTLPVSTSNTSRKMVKSDLIPIASIPRTDGGTFPLLTIMAYVSTPSTLRLIGKSDATTDMTSWATHPTMPMLYRYNNGDCVTTPANFTSTTNQSTGPILGVEFIADGQVISTIAVGDSISNGEGAGIAYNGLNFGFKAAFDANTLGGVTYSHFNAAWSGTQTSGFAARLEGAFEAGVLPDVALLQVFSPNNIVGGTITADMITAMRRDLSKQLDLCAKYNVRPIIWTGLPNSLADYGASDLLRQAYNDTLRDFAGRGIQVLDFDAIAREATPNVNGRYGFKAGFSTDAIHPDDSGIAEEAGLVGSGVQNLGLNWNGAVVTV